MTYQQNEDGTWSKAEPEKASWEKGIKLTFNPVTLDIGFAIGLLIGLIVVLISR